MVFVVAVGFAANEGWERTASATQFVVHELRSITILGAEARKNSEKVLWYVWQQSVQGAQKDRNVGAGAAFLSRVQTVAVYTERSA